MEDLQHLHNLGSREEARSLQRNADAAMLRTALWENTAQGGIDWHQMQRERERGYRAMRHVTRSARQADWHRNHIATIIHHHISSIAAQSLSQRGIRESLTKESPPFSPQRTTFEGKLAAINLATHRYETNPRTTHTT